MLQAGSAQTDDQIHGSDEYKWKLIPMEKLRDGISKREVAKWLGVQDKGEIMKRYREALAGKIATVLRRCGGFYIILRCILC